MIGILWAAAYVAVVCAVSAAATGQLLPRTARTAATAADRGWFPGGEEDEPAPDPQPEQHTPSWARP